MFNVQGLFICKTYFNRSFADFQFIHWSKLLIKSIENGWSFHTFWLYVYNIKRFGVARRTVASLPVDTRIF